MAAIAAPLWVSPAYDDRDAVWRRVIAEPSYPMMFGSAGYGEMTSDRLPPWFRAHWALDGQAVDDQTMAMLHDERFVEAAKRLFGAEVVRPTTLLVNLMGPMAAGRPHVDTPSFRGLKRSEVPIWMLVCMGASGLFERWSIRVAGAITWFYDREDGEFEYWPGEHDGSVVVHGPFGNDAFVSDNDLMRHRVGAIGEPIPASAGCSSSRFPLAASSTIEWTAASTWSMRTDGEPVATLAPGDVRVSILWKALTFTDVDDVARFDDHRDDLDVDTIVRILRADLSARGVAVDVPADPLGDPAWISAITSAYLPRA